MNREMTDPDSMNFKAKSEVNDGVVCVDNSNKIHANHINTLLGLNKVINSLKKTHFN